MEVASTPASPSPRVGSASSSLHAQIYLFSGRGGEAMAPVEENGAVWVFDPATTARVCFRRRIPPSHSLQHEAITALPATATTKSIFMLNAQKQDVCRISGLSNHPAAHSSNLPMRLLQRAVDLNRFPPRLAIQDERLRWSD